MCGDTWESPMSNSGRLSAEMMMMMVGSLLSVPNMGKLYSQYGKVKY